jgi:hypothetical protein
VADSLNLSLENLLQTRLTHHALAELSELLSDLRHVSLDASPDRRCLNLPGSPSFTSRGAYLALHAQDPILPYPTLIWDSRLPRKLKFFGWLLHFDRTNSRANLFRRNIKTLDESLCPASCKTLETNDHIFTSCPQARRIWDSLRINVAAGDQQRPSEIGAALNLPSVVRLDAVMIILWNIWKCRNALIFDLKDTSVFEVLRNIHSDICAWAMSLQT